MNRHRDQSDELILSMAQVDFFSNLLVVLLLMIGSQSLQSVKTGAANSGGAGQPAALQVYLVETNLHIGNVDGPAASRDQLDACIETFSRTNRAPSPVVVLNHAPDENAGQVFATLVQLQKLTNAQIKIALLNRSLIHEK